MKHLALDRPSVEMPDFLRHTHVVDSAVIRQCGLDPSINDGVHALHGGTYGNRQRDPHNPTHERQDRELVRLGLMTPRSYKNARTSKPRSNALRTIVFNGDRLLGVSYDFNLRTNTGSNWLGYLMNGSGAGTSAGFGFTATATATASGTTTLTGPAGFAPTANQYVGHTVVMGAAYATILSHTTGASAVLTLDRWYDPTVTTGAAAATPTAGVFVILPGQGPAYWMALSNDATAVNTTDTALPSEITTNGLGRARSTLAFTPPSASNTATNQLTYTLQVTFTSSGGAISFQKSGVYNAQNGGILIWDSLVTATTLQGTSGDQAQMTWTVNA